MRTPWHQIKVVFPKGKLIGSPPNMGENVRRTWWGYIPSVQQNKIPQNTPFGPLRVHFPMGAEPIPLWLDGCPTGGVSWKNNVRMSSRAKRGYPGELVSFGTLRHPYTQQTVSTPHKYVSIKKVKKSTCLNFYKFAMVWLRTMVANLIFDLLCKKRWISAWFKRIERNQKRNVGGTKTGSCDYYRLRIGRCGCCVHVCLRACFSSLAQ